MNRRPRLCQFARRGAPSRGIGILNVCFGNLARAIVSTKGLANYLDSLFVAFPDLPVLTSTSDATIV
jgi:hypothetical protein